MNKGNKGYETSSSVSRETCEFNQFYESGCYVGWNKRRLASRKLEYVFKFWIWGGYWSSELQNKVGFQLIVVLLKIKAVFIFTSIRQRTWKINEGSVNFVRVSCSNYLFSLFFFFLNKRNVILTLMR